MWIGVEDCVYLVVVVDCCVVVVWFVFVVLCECGIVEIWVVGVLY